MDESIPDLLLKVANVLHFLGRYREANVLTLLSRWLRARGIETDETLRGATEAAERDAFSRDAMGTAAEPEAIARLGMPPPACTCKNVFGDHRFDERCPVHGRAPQNPETPAQMTECPFCKGRGWFVGECHPQEECGACDGTGQVKTFREAPEVSAALDALESQETSERK